MSDEPVPHRIQRGELISAISAVILLGAMFFTEWYGVDQLPTRGLAGAGRATAENAWHGLTLVRWVMLLTVIVAVGSVVLHATQSPHGAKTDTGLVVAVLGVFTSALLAYRVLIALPSSNQVVDQKFGAILGLLSALGIALGGSESISEERARAGKVPQRSKRRKRLASRGPAR